MKLKFLSGRLFSCPGAGAAAGVEATLYRERINQYIHLSLECQPGAELFCQPWTSLCARGQFAR